MTVVKIDGQLKDTVKHIVDALDRNWDRVTAIERGPLDTELLFGAKLVNLYRTNSR